MDDTIFWSPGDSKTDQSVGEIRKQDFELIDDEEVESFLGIKIDTIYDNTIIMSQPVGT